MAQDRYVTVRIPKGLADEIDEILRSGLHGYGSRAELVKEAVRLRLEALTRNRSIKSKIRFKEEKYNPHHIQNRASVFPTKFFLLHPAA